MMLHPEQMHIVLSADRRYAEQVTTLLKSICFHDTHIHFYLIHQDYSGEWFKGLNQHLAHFNSQISNVFIKTDSFKQLKTTDHLSEASFYRCLIPQLINAEKVLYLDSDIIINSSLRPLYNTNIDNYLAAAVEDYILSSNHFIHTHLAIKPYLNSGVILFNNKKWRELPNFQQQLLNAIEEYQLYKGDLGDQDLLNILLQGKWLPLNRIYNYQFGNYYYLQQMRRMDIYAEIMDIQNQTPVVLHYNCVFKPWHPHCKNELPIEKLYWKFQRLEWSELIKMKQP